MQDLRDRSASELELQSAADAIVGRTFRSVVMCRDDAPIASETLPECMLEFSFRIGKQGTTEKSKRLIDSINDSYGPSTPSNKSPVIRIRSGFRLLTCLTRRSANDFP